MTSQTDAPELPSDKSDGIGGVLGAWITLVMLIPAVLFSLVAWFAYGYNMNQSHAFDFFALLLILSIPAELIVAMLWSLRDRNAFIMAFQVFRMLVLLGLIACGVGIFILDSSKVNDVLGLIVMVLPPLGLLALIRFFQGRVF